MCVIDNNALNYTEKERTKGKKIKKKVLSSFFIQNKNTSNRVFPTIVNLSWRQPLPPSKTRFSLYHRYSHFAQRHSKSGLPSTTPCAILELYRYHSGIEQQSENSHFAQDNSRIVPILTLRRTYIQNFIEIHSFILKILGKNIFFYMNQGP